MIKLMICVILLISLTGCNVEIEIVPEHTRITPQRAQEMMEQYNVIILDVRTSAEFQAGHIQGAVLLPHDRIRAEAEYLIPDKDQIVLVYCQRGNRSNTAALTLVDMGYRAVYDFGGIVEWPGPVER